jgi:TnpA family transposase
MSSCRRIHIGLNKGEARNALARAVFFNRLDNLTSVRYLSKMIVWGIFFGLNERE